MKAIKQDIPKPALCITPSKNPKPPADIKKATVRLSFIKSFFEAYPSLKYLLKLKKKIIPYPVNFILSSTIGAIKTDNLGMFRPFIVIE